MVECAALEKRYGCKPIEGSNPSLARHEVPGLPMFGEYTPQCPAICALHANNISGHTPENIKFAPNISIFLSSPICRVTGHINSLLSGKKTGNFILKTYYKQKKRALSLRPIIVKFREMIKKAVIATENNCEHPSWHLSAYLDYNFLDKIK